jgi:hypothetical protein
MCPWAVAKSLGAADLGCPQVVGYLSCSTCFSLTNSLDWAYFNDGDRLLKVTIEMCRNLEIHIGIWNTKTLISFY